MNSSSVKIFLANNKCCSPAEHVVRGLAGAEQVAGGVAAGRLRGEPAEAVGGAAETAAAGLLGLLADRTQSNKMKNMKNF